MGQRMEFDVEKSAFTMELVIGQSGREAFQILLNSNWLASVHPKVDQASFREEGGELQGPDSHGIRLYWAIGVNTEDLVHVGDHVKIFLVIEGGLPKRVYWERYDPEAHRQFIESGCQSIL